MSTAVCGSRHCDTHSSCAQSRNDTDLVHSGAKLRLKLLLNLKLHTACVAYLACLVVKLLQHTEQSRT